MIVVCDLDDMRSPLLKKSAQIQIVSGYFSKDGLPLYNFICTNETLPLINIKINLIEEMKRIHEYGYN